MKLPSMQSEIKQYHRKKMSFTFIAETKGFIGDVKLFIQSYFEISRQSKSPGARWLLLRNKIYLLLSLVDRYTEFKLPQG